MRRGAANGTVVRATPPRRRGLRVGGAAGAAAHVAPNDHLRAVQHVDLIALDVKVRKPERPLAVHVVDAVELQRAAVRHSRRAARARGIARRVQPARLLTIFARLRVPADGDGARVVAQAAVHVLHVAEASGTVTAAHRVDVGLRRVHREHGARWREDGEETRLRAKLRTGVHDAARRQADAAQNLSAHLVQQRFGHGPLHDLVELG